MHSKHFNVRLGRCFFRYEELGTDICNLKSFPQTGPVLVVVGNPALSSLVGFRSFSQVNFSGFRKALKKYDKHLQWQRVKILLMDKIRLTTKDDDYLIIPLFTGF